MAINLINNLIGKDTKKAQVSAFDSLKQKMNSDAKVGANMTRLDGTDAFAGASTIKKTTPISNPIPAESLTKPVTDMRAVQQTVQQAVAPATSGFSASASKAFQEPAPVAPIAPAKETPKTTRQQIEEGMLGLLSKDRTAERDAIRKEAQVQEKAQTANRLLNEIRSIRANYEDKKDKLETINKEGRSMGAINNEINQLTKETNKNLAFKSIEYDIANNDYVSAQETVNNRIKDLNDEDAREKDLYTTLFNFVQNDMSESEKMEAQQAFQEKQGEKDFERQKEIARLNSTLRMNEERASIALKSAVTAQEAEEASRAVLPSLKDKSGQIKDLISKIGSANAVGPNKLARFNPLNFFTGAKADFIGGVEQLTSRETLDTLINLKKAGGTLGALSETELAMLNASASKIGTWRQIDKNGNVTGYKASESDFKKELETLQMLTNRAITNAGGSVEADPLGLGVSADPLGLQI